MGLVPILILMCPIGWGRAIQCNPDAWSGTKLPENPMGTAALSGVGLFCDLMFCSALGQPNPVVVPPLSALAAATTRSGIFRAPNLKPTLNRAKIALKKYIKARAAFHDTREHQPGEHARHPNSLEAHS